MAMLVPERTSFELDTMTNFRISVAQHSPSVTSSTVSGMSCLCQCYSGWCLGSPRLQRFQQIFAGGLCSAQPLQRLCHAQLGTSHPTQAAWRDHAAYHLPCMATFWDRIQTKLIVKLKTHGQLIVEVYKLAGCMVDNGRQKVVTTSPTIRGLRPCKFQRYAHLQSMEIITDQM